jgi:hypothetical protein
MTIDDLISELKSRTDREIRALEAIVYRLREGEITSEMAFYEMQARRRQTAETVVGAIDALSIAVTWEQVRADIDAMEAAGGEQNTPE